MEVEKKQNVKPAWYGLRKTFWSYQSVVNTLFALFFIVSSIGLWTCLVEISKLKQSTNSLVETVSLIKGIPFFDEVGNVNTAYTDLIRKYGTTNIRYADSYDKAENKQNKSYKRDSTDNQRSVHKRSAVPIGMAYDPLSPAPREVSHIYIRFDFLSLSPY